MNIEKYEERPVVIREYVIRVSPEEASLLVHFPCLMGTDEERNKKKIKRDCALGIEKIENVMLDLMRKLRGAGVSA